MRQELVSRKGRKERMSRSQKPTPRMLGPGSRGMEQWERNSSKGIERRRQVGRRTSGPADEMSVALG